MPEIETIFSKFGVFTQQMRPCFCTIILLQSAGKSLEIAVNWSPLVRHIKSTISHHIPMAKKVQLLPAPVCCIVSCTK